MIVPRTQGLTRLTGFGLLTGLKLAENLRGLEPLNDDKNELANEVGSISVVSFDVPAKLVVATLLATLDVPDAKGEAIDSSRPVPN